MKLRGEKLTPRATAAGRVEWLRDRFEEGHELTILSSSKEVSKFRVGFGPV